MNNKKGEHAYKSRGGGSLHVRLPSDFFFNTKFCNKLFHPKKENRLNFSNNVG